MHPPQRQPTGKRRIETRKPQCQTRPCHAAVQNRNLTAQMGKILMPFLTLGLVLGLVLGGFLGKIPVSLEQIGFASSLFFRDRTPLAPGDVRCRH
jgi:hypothetical protein